MNPISPTAENFPPRVICIQHWLGGRITQETWSNADSENDMEWLEHFKTDTLRHRHPLVKLTVASYIYESSETVVPSNPGSLVDVVGP